MRACVPFSAHHHTAHDKAVLCNWGCLNHACVESKIPLGCTNMTHMTQGKHISTLTDKFILLCKNLVFLVYEMYPFLCTVFACRFHSCLQVGQSAPHLKGVPAMFWHKHSTCVMSLVLIITLHMHNSLEHFSNTACRYLTGWCIDIMTSFMCAPLCSQEGWRCLQYSSNEQASNNKRQTFAMSCLGLSHEPRLRLVTVRT